MLPSSVPEPVRWQRPQGCRPPAALLLFAHWLYIGGMLLRSPRGRPINAPAAFIHPCRPVIASRPPGGLGWAHELKHDGYRLQIHVQDGRVRLYTMNGADWSKRYPVIGAEAARLKGSAILDAEVVCSTKTGAGFWPLAQPLLRSRGGCLRIRPVDAQWRRHAAQAVCRTQGSFRQAPIPLA